MPAYEGKLTDEEIWNVLAFIKSQWPEEIQKNTQRPFLKTNLLPTALLIFISIKHERAVVVAKPIQQSLSSR